MRSNSNEVKMLAVYNVADEVPMIPKNSIHLIAMRLFDQDGATYNS